MIDVHVERSDETMGHFHTDRLGTIHIITDEIGRLRAVFGTW